MNFLKTLFPSSSSLKTAPIHYAASPCSTCEDPCSVHPQLSTGMQKRIDVTSELYNTFKPYVRHVLVRFGTGKTWENAIEEKEGFVNSLQALLATKEMKGRVMMTAYEEFDLAGTMTDVEVGSDMSLSMRDSVGTVGTVEAVAGMLETLDVSIKADVVLLPDGLHFPTADLDILANHILSTVPKLASVSTCVPTSVLFPKKILVLVCSHWKRDKRCGVAGPMLLKEFAKEINAAGTKDVGLYGVSHIGGHKFAGNIIVYRVHEGRWVADWYGRVKTCHVAALVRECLAGRVVKELWRGRMGEVSELEKD